MNTKEFVTMQLAKPFKERRIPDALYIRKRNFHATLLMLTSGQPPETAGYCFDHDFMYENYTRFINDFDYLYPNVVITQEGYREYSRIYNDADG